MTEVEFLQDSVNVTIPETYTRKPRSFAIRKPEWIKVLREYVEMRDNIPQDRFLLQIKFGKVTMQPFGHNAIGQFPQKIAKFLNLKNDHSYSGHCFRKTADDLFNNPARKKIDDEIEIKQEPMFVVAGPSSSTDEFDFSFDEVKYMV